MKNYNYKSIKIREDTYNFIKEFAETNNMKIIDVFDLLKDVIEEL